MKTYLIVLGVLMSSCYPSLREHREACPSGTTKSGATVLIGEGASEKLTCETYQQFEDTWLDIFGAYHTEWGERLKERMPYLRVEVWPKGEQPLPQFNADGFTRCDAIYIAIRGEDEWRHTALPHELIHLAQDCWALGAPKPNEFQSAHAGHENWCAAGAWHLLEEVNGLVPGTANSVCPTWEKRE